MKILKGHFSKNGLDYTLIKRNDKVALFRLGPEFCPDGYEVSRIYVMRLLNVDENSHFDSEVIAECQVC